MAPPPAHRTRVPPGRQPVWAVRVLAWYLLFVALACTAAPLFGSPDVNVLLALVQIPLCLWAVHRHDRRTAAASEPGEDRPWA